VPGFALHHELEFLSGAGLSNMDVLRAATSRAAEALWRDDLGVIAPGKRADVVLLRRNPIDDLAALRDIECVIHDGRQYDPKELIALSTAVAS
jgi:imidazolonepropionase-like amidohydrolase